MNKDQKTKIDKLKSKGLINPLDAETAKKRIDERIAELEREQEKNLKIQGDFLKTF